MGDNRKCQICKEMAPVIKNAKGYTIDIQYNGKLQHMTISQLKQNLGRVKMEDIKSQLSMDMHPSEYIVGHVFIASPVIRPDRRVQNTVKSQDDYTVSLQTIAKHVLMLNDMSESDQRFNKLYDSFIQMLQQY